MSKVKVVKDEKIIFEGNILDIPIKNDEIINKSIEVFADDDPCIIHKSYVVKLFVDDLLAKTNLKTLRSLNLQEYKKELSYLDFDLDNCMIYYVE